MCYGCPTGSSSSSDISAIHDRLAKEQRFLDARFARIEAMLGLEPLERPLQSKPNDAGLLFLLWQQVFKG